MIGRQRLDEVYGWVPQPPWVDRPDYDEKKRLQFVLRSVDLWRRPRGGLELRYRVPRRN